MSARCLATATALVLGLVFASLLPAFGAFAACEAQQAALTACLQQSAGCQANSDCAGGQTCDLGQCVTATPPACPAVTCITHCSQYVWNGTDYTGCDQYTDYCARAPSCVMYCTHHVWNGTDYTGCDQYADTCSSGAPAFCN